jgi:hypothetical protein
MRHITYVEVARVLVNAIFNYQHVAAGVSPSHQAACLQDFAFYNVE